MRRGISFTRKAYIMLAITASFNLMAIVFDQLVVQQEDKIRKFDHIINEQKQEVSQNLYANKIFKELSFKVQFNASDFITDINYLVRATNFLNSNISKKISNDQIVDLRETYIKKIKNLVNKFHNSINDTKFVFEKMSKDSSFIKFLRKERAIDDASNPSYPINRIEKTFQKVIDSKNDYFLSNYNFNALTEKEQSDNFPIYTRLYNKLTTFNDLKYGLDDLSVLFKDEFNTSFSLYNILLDDYAGLKNLKNYLILISILFQILGLVSLIFLFRTLILENK